ncbi:reverse transcriptase domain-containing protein [Tanacetum coccineum]
MKLYLKKMARLGWMKGNSWDTWFPQRASKAITRKNQDIAGIYLVIPKLGGDAKPRDITGGINVENAFLESEDDPEGNLFIYLAASGEAVSAVLLVVRKGKQYLVHYVSRTLHDAEQNYAPLEKLEQALRHVSRRLRMYFEAHPFTVITYQPINGSLVTKQMLRGKLA